MILIDALYINNSGGKILLDYLFEELNLIEEKDIYFILDKRIENNHIKIDKYKHEYIKPSWFSRYKFYYVNRRKFKKIFCFGNLPPNIYLNSYVLTYFHQPLFIKTDTNLSYKTKLLILVKTIILKRIIKNTNLWIVQSEFIKQSISSKYKINLDNIKVLPFYKTLSTNLEFKRELYYLYVSNGEKHKNHQKLIQAFIKFYDIKKIGSLHLTIDESYKELVVFINDMIALGYPIVNHGVLGREELTTLYRRSKYCIYPSLTESFGLGIIEAVENGCILIGADRPYMHAICKPNLVFDPESITDITSKLVDSLHEDTNTSILYTTNKIKELLNIII